MAPGLSDEAPTPASRVRVSDDASGMAVMIADLLTDNVSDFRTRGLVASRLRGSLVLTAADRDISVTVTFAPDEIVVEDGARPGYAALEGPWLEMAKVCSGRLSPARAMAGGHLRAVPGRDLGVALAAGFVLSVPASFYGESVWPRRLIVAGSVAAAVTVVAVSRRRARR